MFTLVCIFRQCFAEDRTEKHIGMSGMNLLYRDTHLLHDINAVFKREHDPFLCGGTFSGADAPALQCVPRTVLCPVLRPLPWEFGALCACVALLIPKSGELILNNI